MTDVNDLREKDKNSWRGKNATKDNHPSYGMINISHVSQCGGGKGANLFGSGINHTHFLSLTIETATRYRDEYSEHYHPREKIISVFLSPAQLAGLMTQSNTVGVPCTIDWTQKEGKIENCPDHNIKQEMSADLKRKFKNLADQISSLEKNINARLKGPLRKKEKDEIKFDVLKICQAVRSNLTFLQDCQSEKLEEIQTQMIAEAEHTINHLIKTAGLEAIQNQIKTTQIEEPPIKLIRRKE